MTVEHLDAVSIGQHRSAYVSIRSIRAAYVSVRPELVTVEHLDAVSRKIDVRDVAASVRAPAIRQHTSAYVSIR